MGAGDDAAAERFHATSGRLTGALTIVVAGAIVLIGFVERSEGFPDWVIAASVLAAVLAWAVMLRPGLWVADGILVMRNMLETVHVPLAAIEEMAVRQVLAVRAGDRRYVSTVIGRSWRRSAGLTRRRPAPDDGRTPTDLPYADFAEERLRRLVDDARSVAGVRPGSTEQLALASAVRREPAWLPIVLVALAVLGLLVTLVS
jgi:hypothetical protein